jgi:hypothetical protein
MLFRKTLWGISVSNERCLWYFLWTYCWSFWDELNLSRLYFVLFAYYWFGYQEVLVWNVITSLTPPHRSHVTSQAFDICVFEIDVYEWGSQTSISKTQKSKTWLVTWENTNHPLTNVNLKNTEIKSLACDMRKHEPPTHKRQSQKHRNQKLGLWYEKTRTTHSQT